MIEVEDLVRSFGEREVLKGLTFAAPTGAVTGFLGPNGAGKTTTMRILATLLQPHGGRVEIAGFDVVRNAHDVRRQIGLVTEEPDLLNRLTVREQLAFACRAHRLGEKRTFERIDWVSDRLGLTTALDTRAGALSKGNRQKAALGRALVHDPAVLLLDEPTANLDVVAQDGLQRLLRDPDVIRDRTVLLSTHVIDEAERVCDRVVGLLKGRAALDASVDELRRTREGDGSATSSVREAILSVFRDSDLAETRT